MVRGGSLHECNVQCIVFGVREMFIRRKVITAALIPTHHAGRRQAEASYRSADASSVYDRRGRVVDSRRAHVLVAERMT